MSEKTTGPGAGNNRKIQKLFNRVADQVARAGDRCREQGGRNACAVFDITGGLLRHAPTFLEGLEEEQALGEAEPLSKPAAQLQPPPTPASPPVPPPAPVADATPAPAEPKDALNALFADATTAGKGGSGGQS